MKNTVSITSERNGDQGTSLKKIYSELIITTGEWRATWWTYIQMNTKTPSQSSKQSLINLLEIFKPISGQKTTCRRVLTKGVAGIGKSFAVKKFNLDWAEERINQDIDLVFSFAFREMRWDDEFESERCKPDPG